ncbi:MAG: DUF58 domain-containing protein [Fimbriimonas sp.]|nr:DUF58 domain-containing protein [Fimbriimonas sp.]
MRRVAGRALSVASLFLGLVAVLINAPALFYMSFALIATLAACHIQSNLATKALRIDRIAPKSVHVGELVTVEIVLWSDRKIKRPLVTVDDNLPPRLYPGGVGPSLPVAPAFDLPVRTMYQFTPLKRGRFRWKNLKVTATDALGLTTKTVEYPTEQTEIVVVPLPIPVSIELPSSAGWGINEAISGQAAGAGIEPRGIRQYAYGDSLRHVHWRTSARTGVLQVKEFQAGSQGAASFVIQRSSNTDVGKGNVSTLDAICGHSLFIAEQMLRQGVSVTFPLMEEERGKKGEAERKEEVALLLGTLIADSPATLGADLLEAASLLESGATLYVFTSVDDGSLVSALQRLRGRVSVVVLVYEAAAYDPKRLADSAALFSEAYRQAGAHVVLMPEVAG